MINFDKIKFSNLGSYGDVPFEMCFRDAKVFAFTGVNGSGKSTLLEAITFALYGKPWRKVPKAKIVNNKNKRGCRSEIWFSDDSVEYHVVRGIKPDIFEIRRNGELINQDAKSRDYQKLLEEEILKLSWDAFNQVVIIGKATYVPFMQLDASKRRGFVESVLGLRVFSDMRDHHRVEVAGAEKAQAAANAGHAAAVPAIAAAQSTLDSYQKMMEDTSAPSAADAMAAIEQLRGAMASAARTSREAEESLASATSFARASILAAADKLKDGVEECRVTLDRAISAEETAKVDRQAVLDFVNNEERDASRLDTAIKGIDTRTSCPTCGGAIDASSAAKHVAELKEQADAHRANAAAAAPDLAAATLALDGTKNAVLAASAALRAADNRYNDAKNVPVGMDDAVIAASAAVSAAKIKWDSIGTDIRLAETAHAAAVRRETELEGLVAAATVKLADATKRVESLAADVEITEKILQIFSVCSTLLKDTGAKATIIRRYVPVINSVVNDLLAEMGFFARFELDDEFNDKIMSQGFDEMSYNSYSEGEKLRVDMAVLLAWRELCILTGSSSSNLIIFDEILDGSFDQQGLDAFMTAMASKDNLHLICITHHPDRIEHFTEKHFAFEKVDGYSTYSISEV